MFLFVDLLIVVVGSRVQDTSWNAVISLGSVRANTAKIGSLRNHTGNAGDKVVWKLNLYFTYESRDTLKSFTLFISIKTITKLNPEHSDKFQIKIQKISCRGSRSQDNAGKILVISRWWILRRAAKKYTMNYNARAPPLSCSLILLFSHVPVAVAVVVLQTP